MKEIKFEVVWHESESKKCFQRQAVGKYLGLSLVFMRNNGPREKYNCYFRDIFSKQKIIFSRGLGTRLSFYEV